MDSRIVKRKLSNFLLQPLLQSKIGLYYIAMSLLFCTSLAGMLYMNLNHLYGFVINLTDAPDEVENIIFSSLSNLQNGIYICVSIYIICVIAVSIWYTHRLVGPMVAFRKHFEALEAGDFSHRTILRKRDAFQETADKLNQATASLEARAKSSRPSAS